MASASRRRLRLGHALGGLLGLSTLLLVILGIASLRSRFLLDGLRRRDWAMVTGQAKAERHVELELVAEGFEQPTDVQFVPGNPRLAVVLEKTGRARLLQLDGAEPARVSHPAADLFRVAAKTTAELGLLGLAFHPDYANNGLFYLDYNPENGQMRTRIAEWKAASPLSPSSATEQRVLFEVIQPYSNHNGGQLAFGPDGLLYIGLGDGGSANDPHGNGQSLRSSLGKLLRIDPRPSDGRAYTIPAKNPFVGRAEALPEIWAYGLRNPWRFSFTSLGDLIVADVGQGSYEEVDLVRSGDNLGWNVREGGHCFSPPENCSSANLIDPIFEYDHTQGISITGGYVYLGAAVPRLRNKYVFGDFGSGRLWALTLPVERVGAYAQTEPLGQWDVQPSTFARDADGELYVADFLAGKIYRIVGH